MCQGYFKLATIAPIISLCVTEVILLHCLVHLKYWKPIACACLPVKYTPRFIYKNLSIFFMHHYAKGQNVYLIVPDSVQCSRL